MKKAIVKERRKRYLAAKKELKQVVKLYEKGYCATSIAARLGLTKYGVRFVLIAAGYAPRSHDAATLIAGKPYRNSPTAESLLIDAEQKQLYESGSTLLDIAKLYGCSKQAVQQRLKRAGAKMRAVGGSKSVALLVCSQCGKEFKPGEVIGGYVWNSRKNCSRDCAQQAYRNRRRVRGANAGGAILDDAKVLDIKRRLAAGESAGSLAKEHRVSIATISHIKSGRNWKHVTLAEEQ